MKTLDTLISDIYEKLEGLSNGEGLEIPEKELDITLSRIKDGILSWSTPSERNKSFTLRMSNIGRPARQLVVRIKRREQLIGSKRTNTN
jgi:hypothetical protein